MRLKLVTFPLVLATCLAPVYAHASTFDVFTITETTTNAGSTTLTVFTLPGSPGGLMHFSSDEFDIAGTSTVNGNTGSDVLQFYDVAGGGGLCTNLWCSNVGALPALFNGSVSSPTFLSSGTYTFDGGTGGANVYSLTITPQVNPTPEPSSVFLLGTGLVAMAGAARRRFLGR